MRPQLPPLQVNGCMNSTLRRSGLWGSRQCDPSTLALIQVSGGPGLQGWEPLWSQMSSYSISPRRPGEKVTPYCVACVLWACLHLKSSLESLILSRREPQALLPFLLNTFSTLDLF